jgi:hypothetical protein
MYVRKFRCFYFAEIRRRCAKCNFHENVHFNVKTGEFKNLAQKFQCPKCLKNPILQISRKVSGKCIFTQAIFNYKFLWFKNPRKSNSPLRVRYYYTVLQVAAWLS